MWAQPCSRRNEQTRSAGSAFLLCLCSMTSTCIALLTYGGSWCRTAFGAALLEAVFGEESLMCIAMQPDCCGNGSGPAFCLSCIWDSEQHRQQYVQAVIHSC